MEQTAQAVSSRRADMGQGESHNEQDEPNKLIGSEAISILALMPMAYTYGLGVSTIRLCGYRLR